MTVQTRAMVLVLATAVLGNGIAYAADAGPALASVRAELIAVREAQGRPRGPAARRERAAVVQAIRRLRAPPRHLGDDLRVAAAVLRRLDRGFPLGIDPGSNLGASLSAVRAELTVCVADEITTITRVTASETDEAARAAVLAELDLAQTALADAGTAPTVLGAVQRLVIADAHNLAAARGLRRVAGDLTFLLDSVALGALPGSFGDAKMDATGTVLIEWYGPGALEPAGDFDAFSLVLTQPGAGARTASSVYVVHDGSRSEFWSDTQVPVTITVHDPRTRVISGTFAFELGPLDPEGTPVTVEQGSFALRYAPR